MDPRLLRYYNEELRHLKEMGAEFKEQFPKIAARLGIEGLEVVDPYVERLIQGFAFLAARIQLKLDAEFPRFTQRLLEIVYPQFLAPTPSMLIAQLQPELGDASLAAGVTIPRGSAMQGRAAKVTSTQCEFRTSHDVTMWPVELTSVEYFHHAAELPLEAHPEWRKYRSGLRLRLRTTAGLDFSQLLIEDLRLHCAGRDEQAYRIHELVVGHALGVLVLPVDRAAKWHESLDPSAVVPVGFESAHALLPRTPKGFEGYRLIEEYFAFPQRFLFFDLCGIGEALRAHGGKELEIVILFSRADAALQQSVTSDCLALNCVPAINLLERPCDRIHVTPATRDFHIVVDGTRPIDFEIHSITEVLGFGAGVRSQYRFLPFYAAFHMEESGHNAYFSVQREPRMLSKAQERESLRKAYVGTEMYVSIVDANEAPYPDDLRTLGVRALCTNRDLPLNMPVGNVDEDLSLVKSAPVKGIRIIKGPSRPLPALRDRQQGASHEGDAAWKLINQLSLNHLSLSDTYEHEGAAALREVLRLYAPAGDAAAQRQIDGLLSVKLRPAVRRLPMPGPITFGRGVQADIEVDELAFQGASPFLFGCLLERYFARQVSLNSFTQVRVSSQSLGEIMMGAPRCGTRPIL